MQARDQVTGEVQGAAHGSMVPRSALAPRGTLDGVLAPLLTSRRHVDLQRVGSALCSPGR